MSRSPMSSSSALEIAERALSSDDWLNEEFSENDFSDVRHHRRLKMLVEAMSNDAGGTIPHACQDDANTKAAYRFLTNDAVSEAEILAGHFAATRQRARACDGPILVLHDTTEFSFERKDEAAIGWTQGLKRGPGRYGQGSAIVKCCGILMHGSLVVTPAGVPLGLSAVRLWNRETFKGSKARDKINDARIPLDRKESVRWLEGMRSSCEVIGDPQRCVHIGDRESDMIEFFATAEELGTQFLIRTSANRVASEDGERVSSIMATVPVAGTHRIENRNAHGETREIVLHVKYKTLTIYPPEPKAKVIKPIELTVIYASEANPPKNQAKVEWKLLTNLPVTSLKSAITKLNWYALRWKIETYHKILKSGCKVEDSKLRTKERLTNLIAVCCIVSWRIFWLTMINRADARADPKIALTKIEIEVLDLRVRDKTNTPREGIARYIQKIARLGGYLARNNDPPPGNVVMWRGLTRLADIVDGASLIRKLCG